MNAVIIEPFFSRGLKEHNNETAILAEFDFLLMSQMKSIAGGRITLLIPAFTVVFIVRSHT
jgi:hypothetical protein